MAPVSSQPGSAGGGQNNPTILMLLVAILVVVLITLGIVLMMAMRPSPAAMVQAPPAPGPSPVHASDAAYRPAASRSPLAQANENLERPIAAARLDAPASPAAAPTPGAAPAETATAAGEVIPWGRAGQYIDQTITTQGKIIDTRNLGNICFLNFSRDRQSFYVVIFKRTFDAFPEAPEKHFLNKTIRVTGKVSEHKGRAQIQVSDAGQIQIVP